MPSYIAVRAVRNLEENYCFTRFRLDWLDGDITDWENNQYNVTSVFIVTRCFDNAGRWSGIRKDIHTHIHSLQKQTFRNCCSRTFFFFTGRMPCLPSNQQRQSIEVCQNRSSVIQIMQCNFTREICWGRTFRSSLISGHASIWTRECVQQL